MNTEQQELLERLSIQKAFELYFKYANCSDYRVTGINTSNRIDAIITSATTDGSSNIIVEWKNRNYTLSKNYWNSSMIEYTKYKYLVDVVKWSGNTCWYVNQFEDYIIVHDVKAIFNKERDLPLDHYFYNDSQRRNNYSNDKVESWLGSCRFMMQR